MSVCAGVLHVHYKQEMFQRVVLLPSGQVLVAGGVGGMDRAIFLRIGK